jgi:hypothetical protein
MLERDFIADLKIKIGAAMVYVYHYSHQFNPNTNRGTF